METSWPTSTTCAAANVWRLTTSGPRRLAVASAGRSPSGDDHEHDGVVGRLQPEAVDVVVTQLGA